MNTKSRRYIVWNNKGGVGKSSLSFMLATEYAIANPEQTVIAIDMCPQANLSEIFLGGASGGVGGVNVSKLIEEKLTIGAYINQRFSSPHQRLKNEASYLVHPFEMNKNIPKSLFLACGDPSLEIQAQVINQIGAQNLPIDGWKNVRFWLKDLIDGCLEKYQNSTFFIDCNPSFSAYTELAMAAGNRLIIPCTSDGSSARAIDNIGSLLYGIGQSENELNYANKAKKFKIDLPLIHTIIFNRSTVYNKKASKAFKAMNEEIQRRIKTLQENHPEFFVQHAEPINLFETIPDTHSASIVCSYMGMPLSNLKPGPYTIHDVPTQVNVGPLNAYQNVIRNLVSALV